MAGREVIHFPLRVQLDPFPLFPARIPFEPANLITTNLIPPYRCPLTGAAFSCLQPAIGGRGQ